MDRRRVVVTGLGVVSPVGKNVEDTWSNIKAGVSGIAPITLFDASALPVRIAGEVKNFDVTSYGIDASASRKMARFSQFLLAASVQAVENAGFSKENLSKQKVGVFVGNCIGGLEVMEAGFKKYFDENAGPLRVPPLTTPLMIINEAAANVNIYYGLQKVSWTLSTACASGTDALGAAADLIRSGRLDMCISGGTEAAISGFGIASFTALKALSTHYNDAPEKASRPFDKDRDGFVLGEGAAVFILEELEHAKARGAKIYAEIAGFGSSCDAYHITAPLADGSGAAVAMREALDDAGISGDKITYYNAHGTGTHANDPGETKMLKTVFGEHAYKMHVSSTKSMTGHLVGGAGAIEALFCVKAICDSFVPPTIHLDNPDMESGCDLDYTPNVGVKADIEYAASSSLGFGGHNGCIIIKRYS